MAAPAERVQGGQPTADWMIIVIQSPDRASELKIIQRGTTEDGWVPYAQLYLGLPRRYDIH